MPEFTVATPYGSYMVVVERGSLGRVAGFLPPRHGKLFVVTTSDVWELHGSPVGRALAGTDFHVIHFIGGEDNKRLAQVERMAAEMSQQGADRSSVVIAFGGGIVNDLGGFLAAIFMRGVPVIQVPTTLLAQVDAAVGGKTGANLVAGKNLIGAFHQPLAVLVDPAVLHSLPPREYHAGLFEVIKHGIIADAPLFQYLSDFREEILAKSPPSVDRIIADSVRLKARVVSGDEKEADLRKILNFGHTFGHALEAETRYTRYLHGEAVSWGMRAATYLAADLGLLPADDAIAITALLDAYGPIPRASGIQPEALQAHLVKDKKTIQGKIHFVLPTAIGSVTVTPQATPEQTLAAIEQALADCR